MAKNKDKKSKGKKSVIKDIEDHSRINDILLGFIERPAIDWLVEHLPGWVMPDHLTFLDFWPRFWSASVTGSPILIPASSGWPPSAFSSTGLATAWTATLPATVRSNDRNMDFSLTIPLIPSVKYSFFSGSDSPPMSTYELACIALVGYLCMANLVYITTSVEGEFKISYGSLRPHRSAHDRDHLQYRSCSLLAIRCMTFPIGQFSLYNLSF